MTAWEISINNSTENTTDNPADNSTDKAAEDSGATGSEAAAADRWTIKRLLDWTTGYFRDSGFEQPRLDAEVLLAEALDCQRIELYTRFDEEPPAAVKGIFRDWVARHAEGEPVAYLVEHKEFFSLKFEVNSSVLIPRPETEHLVTEALDAIKLLQSESAVDAAQVIDVGTGSGCVAIAIARHAAHAQVSACDISQEALLVAARNVVAHGLTERVHLTDSDLLAGVAEPEKFHVIVSNPPYIGLAEKTDLAKSVVDFEPHEALFSDDETGTGIIRRLVQQAADRLHSGGYLMFEISPMIADRCREIVSATSGLTFEKFINDLAGHKRIVVARHD